MVAKLVVVGLVDTVVLGTVLLVLFITEHATPIDPSHVINVGVGIAGIAGIATPIVCAGIATGPPYIRKEGKKTVRDQDQLQGSEFAPHFLFILFGLKIFSRSITEFNNMILV
jgi:hypothetical protein